MIKPLALEKEQTLGIVSPSYWLSKLDLERAVALFKKQAYNIKLGDSVFLQDGPFSGTPQKRAEDIHALFCDANIDAIICARGGYGANKVLPLLDFDLIRNHPKIFLGYSDITSYLTSITQKTGMVTFHGPMLSSYKSGLIPYNFGMMEKVLSGEKNIHISSVPELPIQILKPGCGEGLLWGGNMTLISNGLGTRRHFIPEGSILFLEDLDEYFYSFERMLIHFREAGLFDNISGLIFGELIDMKDQEISFGKATNEIIMDICGDLDIPIISNFPCGHGKFQSTLPLSIPVRLDTNFTPLGVTLLDSPVRKGD